jgi:hypothetical protein
MVMALADGREQVASALARPMPVEDHQRRALKGTAQSAPIGRCYYLTSDRRSRSKSGG